MEYLFDALRSRIFHSNHKLLYLEKESHRLQQTIKSTALCGESTSLLIVGRRGCGKSHLIREALEIVKQNELVKSNLIEIHLNGLIHTDDRSALRAISKQLKSDCTSLMNESDKENQSNHDSNQQNPIGFSFIDNLRHLLTEVNSDHKQRAILIIIEEFDLFTDHKNQMLLYNLLDCCQADGTPICIIGVTCRLDMIELLEKRVKSRFSHRQINIYPVAAPREYVNLSTNETASPAFSRYCDIFIHLLSIEPEELYSAYLSDTRANSLTPSDFSVQRLASLKPKLLHAATQWNKHIEELIKSDVVVKCLKQLWYISSDIRHLMSLIIPPLAGLDKDNWQMDPLHFVDSLCELRQDAKINLLRGLSELDLFLITTLVKLMDMPDDLPINLERLYSAYCDFCRTHGCLGHIYEKSVVAKALDQLINIELVVDRRAALEVVNRHGGGPSRHNVIGQVMPNYRPLACFVDPLLLASCLDDYPNCPLELRQWAHSRQL